MSMVTVSSLSVRFSRVLIAAAAGSVAVAAATVSAGSIPLVSDPSQSTAAVDAVTETVWPGFLIGDYDAKTNPGGTLTRPGVFGGSGNLPVTTELTPQIVADLSGAPTGGLSITPDVMGGTIAIDGLSIDLLGGATAAADLTIVFFYQTFRSFNPDSLFPGGFPIPVPFGVVPVLSATMTQVGPAAGTLVPADGSGTLFDVAAVIPVLLTFEIDLLGEVLAVGPLPGTLPVTGQLADAGGAITLSLSASIAESIVDDGPFDVGFDAIPFGLPTVFPEGSIANVLLTGTLTSIDSDQTIDLVIVATGGQAGIPGDLNGDGQVNFTDLLILLTAWGPCPPPCDADLSGDGIVDFADLLILLSNWTG